MLQKEQPRRTTRTKAATQGSCAVRQHRRMIKVSCEDFKTIYQPVPRQCLNNCLLPSAIAYKPRPSHWFPSKPLGHNTLTHMVKEMCSAAGIKGHKTNHSLRATAATRLFHAGTDEQLIELGTIVLMV